MSAANARALFVLAVIIFAALPAWSQTGNQPAKDIPQGPPLPVRLTLDEARARALENSKLLALATLNAQSKGHAVKAAAADYFPKIVGSLLYFHFDQPLGTVVTTQGRPRLNIPGNQFEANVVNKDATFGTVMAAQPITALLKVKQGVKIAKADEQIARNDMEKARRAISVGVEQLYWGWLAAHKLRAGAELAVKGAEAAAKSGKLETRAALVEAKQGLQAAANQVADIEEQLNNLLDLPACTKLELVEPPLPTLGIACEDDLIGAALGASTEIHEAELTIVKAKAAVAAGKVDFLPNVVIMGGYANQDFASYIQQNFSYVGATASYTFLDWGQRRNIVRERRTVESMAHLKLRQVEDEVRQKARKSYREYQQHQAELTNARDLATVRAEAVKKAATSEAMMTAAKAQMLAEVDLVKAELNVRMSVAELLGIMGRQ